MDFGAMMNSSPENVKKAYCDLWRKGHVFAPSWRIMAQPLQATRSSCFINYLEHQIGWAVAHGSHRMVSKCDEQDQS